MMSYGFIAAAAAAMTVAVPLPGGACLSDREGQALVMTALPGIVEAVRSRCLPSLPATATLTQAGQIIAARWQNDAVPVRDEADRAIDKLSAVAMTRLLGRDAARDMVSSIVRQEVTKRLSISRCATANVVIDALSPLQARNIARAVLAVEGGSESPGTLPFSICRTKA